MPVKKKSSAAPPQQIQATFEVAADFKAVYANFIQSAFSPLDVAFVFGEVMQADQSTQTVLTKVRVTMTPAEAKLFQGILATTLKNYEDKFGEIAVPAMMLPLS
jgi:hypothetical protein